MKTEQSTGDRRSRAGISRTEVLVLIAFLTVLVALLIPATQNSLTHPPGFEALNKGRDIYVSLFAASLSNPAKPVSVWPQRRAPFNVAGNARDFPDSTTYFKWCVTSGIMDADFTIFSTRGMWDPATQDPGDPDSFHASNNAWAITVGADHATRDGIPVLFTANISADSKRFTRLLTIDQQAFLAKDGKPYGNKTAIIVHSGGAAFTVNETIVEGFNPSGASNACLYPSQK
jgi:hypothetical protein